MYDAVVPEEVKTMSTAEHNLRVDYLEFPARDIEATKTFYTNVFGWRFEDYGPRYTSFLDGRLSGGFYQSEEVRAGGPLVVIYTTELERIQDKVTTAGGRITKDIFEFPGGRRFQFLDPNGNELGVWSNI
jgi:predicted enzyme related to lactoylglutathione lyase